ncbi:MAG: nitroreductase [Bacteroidales bacterium]|nr:nitroreductase [Bacteroidales bacterium]
MEALENMRARRSCRAFKPDMPERALIEAVCTAGTYAPTGHNKQSPLIVAITNRQLRDQLSAMNAKIWNELTVSHGGVAREGIDPFYGAPVVVVVLANRAVQTAVYDGCAVMCNMLNAATAVGLDSCWIHRAKQEFDSPEGKAILASLGIEGDYEGVGHVVLGYRAKDLPAMLPRKADYIRWVE